MNCLTTYINKYTLTYVFKKSFRILYVFRHWVIFIYEGKSKRYKLTKKKKNEKHI